ncbi:methyltransferase domain-containing protein [Chelatococcus sambhunathii]|uniref:Methyltransferase domain-containing protein n=1 Tax=Chelatococcus sambhunathii TaxID=363953 RepID=A0ABU1DAY5_9HYPH|nr:methyltransferase domain-containing protein [Chelatococcus sambhunathii]MDR4305209.1 methyltransferase domain-containing protein [Chelatococcus sambhunathii]
MKDVTGDSIVASNAGWTFSGEVAQHFDDHVSKSVPLYAAGHELICGLSDFFVGRDSVVYELGCSTGTLSFRLAERNKGKDGARFIGVDIEPEMVARAEQKRAELGVPNVSFVADDIFQAELEPADFIVAYYTVQFVRPAVRQALIDKIYAALNWGGCFVMFEKVRGPDARFQDMLTQMYTYDYKLGQGYNAEEIVSKARSLKGVLEPFSTQGNLDLLSRAGFQDVTTIMKYICFEGFVAIK